MLISTPLCDSHPHPLGSPYRLQALYRRNRMRRAAMRAREYARWVRMTGPRKQLLAAAYAALTLFVCGLAVLVRCSPSLHSRGDRAHRVWNIFGVLLIDNSHDNSRVLLVPCSLAPDRSVWLLPRDTADADVGGGLYSGSASAMGTCGAGGASFLCCHEVHPRCSATRRPCRDRGRVQGPSSGQCTASMGVCAAAVCEQADGVSWAGRGATGSEGVVYHV